MKILVVGASGLIGSQLFRWATHEGHSVVGTQRSQNHDHFAGLDIGDYQACHSLVRQLQPEVTICCAAWPWVDGCEGDRRRAFKENCDNPTTLAKLSQDRGSRFVYISTSYVFDGEEGPYSESATPNPISSYGESKLAGENKVREATGGDAIIARTMGVYGPEKLRKNFVYQVHDNLKVGRQMKIPADQFGNATSSDGFSRMLLALIAANARGIWNIAGPDPTLSRKAFAERIARQYSLNERLLEFVPTESLGQAAKRPEQGGLLIDKAIEKTGIRPSDWDPIAL